MITDTRSGGSEHLMAMTAVPVALPQGGNNSPLAFRTLAYTAIRSSGETKRPR